MATEDGDWTKPQATAIPKGGYFEYKEGNYGPVFPKTPACYGFTVIAKVKPGREAAMRAYADTVEKAIKTNPAFWRRSSSIISNGCSSTSTTKPISCTKASSTPTSTSTPTTRWRSSGGRAEHCLRESGRLSGGLEDERTGVRQVRSRSPSPSFLEYGEYPYVSGDEIKKALRVKQSLSDMLDQMQ